MTTPTTRVHPTRAELLRWAGWFGMANALLAALIGLRYFFYYDFPRDPLGIVYTALAFVGHYASLGLLIVLPVLLLAALWPRRLLVVAPAVLLGATLLTLLLLDANVFAQHRYHLTRLTVAIFEPATWGFIAVIGLIALFFEALLAGTVRQWVAGAPGRHGVMLGLGLVTVWLAGQGIHVWADAIGYRSVTQLTRYLPAYFPIHARRRLARLGLVDPAAVEQQRLLARAGGADGGGQLRYPLAPLQCTPADAPLNVLMVLIDGLRPDAIDPALMPTLAAFRAGGQDFASHSSGGNSSRAGIFTAFYGLPSTYITAFYGVQQPPVLLTELQARHYQLGLFAAPGFGTPADLDRTVFAGVPGLPGKRNDLTAVARNVTVTDEWLGWLGRRDETKPFFGFLYYDPSGGERLTGEDPPLPMEDRYAGAGTELQASWRRYRGAMALSDLELGRVLTDLGERGLADSTVVIVFSDHGYEFGETGGDLIGHASNYGPAQIRATLAMAWPGRATARHTHRTSHYDLPVTLLQDVLGCQGPPGDYSMGRNLFAGRDWDWIIAGSYQSYAIIDPENIIVAHPGGFMEQRDTNYQPVKSRPLDAAVIDAALTEIRRFYR